MPTVQAMRRDHKHDGARPWRGVKRDNWERGHRVPLIARWPGKVKAGGVSDEPICLTDIPATCAAIVGVDLPNSAAEDSHNMLPALLDQRRDSALREHVLHQTSSLARAIRRGRWKYLDHRGSGGNRYDPGGPWGMLVYALPERAPDASGQLYDLEEDPGETTNLYHRHPEIAKAPREKPRAFQENRPEEPCSC